MKDILQEIISNKRRVIAKAKQQRSIAMLESMPLFYRDAFSLKQSLQNRNKSPIIAEFKRRSPSKGVINDKAVLEEVTSQYEKNGAGALSILTEDHFFGGSLDDLIGARKQPIALLRKDFIIDEYQVIETKAYGADIILLIAKCLTKEQCLSFSKIAKCIGLQVLLEVHTEDELDYINEHIDAVGINNRDLKTFKVNIDNSIMISNKIKNGVMKIAESGIENIETILQLSNAGFDGFLIGEYLMRQSQQGVALKKLVIALQNRKQV